MPAAPQLVCVGHLVREMIHFPDRTVGPLLGSPPAYCSLAAAAQGTATAVVSRIGPELDAGLLAPLEEAGVDLSGVQRGAASTTSELIYGTDGQQAHRVPYPGRTARAPPTCRPASAAARLIYVCTMDNDVPPADIPAVAALGRIAAVDLGGYGGVHMSRDRRAQCPSLAALALGVAASFAVVKASDEDLVSIFGRDDPDAAAALLLGRGVPVVVVTAGARGALVYTAGGRDSVPAARARVVDTTGRRRLVHGGVPVGVPAKRRPRARGPVGLRHGGVRHRGDGRRGLRPHARARGGRESRFVEGGPI